MSVDYDQLKLNLEDFDQATSFHAKRVAIEELRATTETTARELLRLRRELTDLRDTMHIQAESLRNYGHRMSAANTEHHAFLLDLIIQGDTE